MTVADVIAKLQAYPPETRAMVGDSFGSIYDIEEIHRADVVLDAECPFPRYSANGEGESEPVVVIE